MEIPLPPPMPQWATWIKHRRPPYKAHPSIGQAKAALSYHYREPVTSSFASGFTSDCALFEFVDGAWVCRASFERGDTKDHVLWTNSGLFKTGMTSIINEVELPGDR